MEIKNLPKKYKKIWEKSLPYLERGRSGDDKHAAEVVEFILNYKGNKKLNLNILIPTAMMHDIGHSAILPEHFKHITGPEKLPNAKLVHMLVGAKIANDILDSIGYDHKKISEIVDIISVHDADLLKEIDLKKFYNTENKKIFHDIDSLDRFTETRLKSVSKMYPNRGKVFVILKESLGSLFYPEFKKIAKQRLKELEQNG